METGNKIKAKADFIDLTQLRNAHPKHRSIQFDSDGLSFSILDLERNTYIGVREYGFEPTDRPQEIWDRYEQLRQQDEWLRLDFHSNSFAWNLGVSTLVPNAFSTPSAEKKLRHFVQPLLASDELYRDNLPAVEAGNIYPLPHDVKSQLKGVEVFHGTTPFLEGMLRQFQNDGSSRVLINVESGQFTMVILIDRKLQLFNRYEFRTAEDFIYYLLFAMEQLNLNPEAIPLTLYGNIEKRSALYEIAYKYVRHIDLGLRPDGFLYAPLLDAIPAHQYYGLFQQYLCVS